MVWRQYVAKNTPLGINYLQITPNFSAAQGAEDAFMVRTHIAVVAIAITAAFVPLTAAQEAKPAAPEVAKPVPPPPTDAKSVLAAVEKAMGAASVKTIQYSGSGSNAGIGQNRNPEADWPLVRVRSYNRELDFSAPASRVQMVRLQGGNEQKQDQTIAAGAAWGQQFDIWLTPHGFLKGAAANPTTVESRTELGVPYTVATFTVQNKYKVAGYIDAQSLLHKVETWVDNTVFGDLKVEALYSDYRDFGGVKFPMTIIQKQDGRNTLILIVNDVKPNAPVNIPAPQQAQTPAAAPPAVTARSERIADGVFYITGGSHHSVAIEFDNYTAVIEAPQNEQRSLAVIREVERVTGEPIRYLINTHHHFDHSGGLRTYVERGATIVTHEVNRRFYERVLSPSAARTLNPDRLALAKKAPPLTIETFTDRKVMTDKSRTVELHLIEGNPHNDGILMVYLPAEKILIEVDVYTPPAADAKPPAVVSPNTTNFVENVERLKLDVERILPLHGPGVATKADLYRFIGKPVPAVAAGN
jgi:glyoxylase-like metal-dependent hydrolase (beta-lactamase superfamily II)